MVFRVSRHPLDIYIYLVLGHSVSIRSRDRVLEKPKKNNSILECEKNPQMKTNDEDGWGNIGEATSIGEMLPALARWWGGGWSDISIGIVTERSDGSVTTREPFDIGDPDEPRRILAVELTPDSALVALGMTKKKLARRGDRRIRLETSELVRPERQPPEHRPSRATSCDAAPIAAVLSRLCTACASAEESGRQSDRMRPFAGFLPEPLLAALSPNFGPQRHRDYARALVANAIARPKFCGSAVVAASLVADAEFEISRGRDLPTAGLLFGTVVQAYFRVRSGSGDPRDVSVHRFSDGRAVERGSEEDSAVRCAWEDSCHRNESQRDDFVLAVTPPSIAIVRSSRGCASCGTAGCHRTLPHVFGGSALLTGSDAAAISGTCAGLEVAASVAVAATSIPECAGFGSATECTCGFLDGDPEPCERCSRERPEASDASAAFVRAFGASAELAMGRRGHAVRRVISRCASALEYTLMPWSTSARMSAYSTDATRSEAGERFSVEVAPPPSRLASFLRSASRPRTARKRSATAPGYRELSDSGWDVASLRSCMPPCIARIVDGCAARHPKYQERVHFLSFLCGIEGVSEDERGMRILWKRMFEHHEDAAARRKLADDADFMRSKYGKAALDDALACARRGFVWGCPSAISDGVCPYSGVGSGIDAVAARISDIEDACPRGLSTSEAMRSEVSRAVSSHSSASATEVCRWACSARASAVIGSATVVRSPIGFYSTLYRSKMKQP